jgi:hypothetical protein
MTRWEREQRLWVCGMAAAAGVFLCIGLLFLKMAVHQVKMVNAQVRHERKAVAHERDVLKRQTELRGAHDKLIDEIGALEPTPPAKLYLPTLIEQVAQLAGQDYLELIGAKPDLPASLMDGDVPPVDAGPYRVSVTLYGGYRNSLLFIDQLQQFRKAVALQAIDMRLDPTSRDGNVTTELVLIARQIPGILASDAMINPPRVTPDDFFLEHVVTGKKPAPGGAPVPGGQNGGGLRETPASPYDAPPEGYAPPPPPMPPSAAPPTTSAPPPPPLTPEAPPVSAPPSSGAPGQPIPPVQPAPPPQPGVGVFRAPPPLPAPPAGAKPNLPGPNNPGHAAPPPMPPERPEDQALAPARRLWSWLREEGVLGQRRVAMTPTEGRTP